MIRKSVGTSFNTSFKQSSKKPLNKWQFGDFQTPLDLADKVVEVLKKNHSIKPDVIIEPTCGEGAFVRAAHKGFANAKVLGFEINSEYVKTAQSFFDPEHLSKKESKPSNDQVSIEVADFFSKDWDSVLNKLQGELLVIGNPPWVTSSELGALNSKNLPEKSNVHKKKGIDAITGSSNFDISEWMLIQTLKWITGTSGTIAFLCKYSVARKIMRQIKGHTDSDVSAYVYLIDAKKHFSASVEACLFVLTTRSGSADCEVYDSLDAQRPSRIIGERDGFIVSNVDGFERWRHLLSDGIFQHEWTKWRSGIKHDCARVMELRPVNGGFENGFGEVISLEDDYVYPLLKSSDVGNCRVQSVRKFVIVTQKAVGEETNFIKEQAPKTWEYLCPHRELLQQRKSSIYRNKPDFSIFGVGPYTFKNWKVAISGLYKKLNFNLVGPMHGRPVVFDDTVNFLSFETKQEAELVYKLMTSKPVTELLQSMIFWDDKRPVTTDLLRRISLQKVADEIGLGAENRRLMKMADKNSSQGDGLAANLKL